MSDKFSGLSLEKLLTWIKVEERTGKIFGIPEALFFRPSKTDVFRLDRYGRVLETPVGVAAGPHTQLAQNIICAWLTGARYIELKTIQVLDELNVTKPCINMEDVGYNCEWSQELKLEQSVNEYLNALIAVHVLKKRLKIGQDDIPGFMFNMSVGYNLEGILSPRVQAFLDTMTDAASFLEPKLETVRSVFPEIGDIHIPSQVSDNITISTMHGCPPDEIEKIALYFIEQRKLNTTIKLNPTLLGAEALRDILNHRLGFDITVPDIAFEHDLKYDDGIGLITRLIQKATSAGVSFNVKLTNTLETENNQGKLPGHEQMVYMSGRALHAISINLASKLEKAFGGKLDISFSAGADCFNLPGIIACGLSPVTMCSDLLKPGGYGRIRQYLSEVESAFKAKSSHTISDYIRKCSPGSRNETEAVLDNLDRYAAAVTGQKAYQKKSFPWSTIKTARKLGPFDCIHAPCQDTCPAGQDIPSYMYYTAAGRFEKAFEVIMATNPFPGIQGMVCDHPCTEKCTRMNYDAPLHIREIKRFIARQHSDKWTVVPGETNRLKAAVIGGGPSGFSASFFLRMNGFEVDLFESKNFPGGMAADAIPGFRLDNLSIQKDIDRIISLGVSVHYGQKIESQEFERIRQAYDYVYIAVGACKAYPLEIPGSTAKGVFDQLEFLSAVRQGRYIGIGKKIAVIGGGNSAMDAARTAKRLAGEHGHVTIIYRRAVEDMPADREEIEEVLFEGIEIIPMTAPSEVLSDKNNRVSGIRCLRMAKGETDSSGRPRPVVIDDSGFDIPADTIISAIGQKVEIPFWKNEPFTVNPVTFQTPLDRVYAGGDAIRGASTLIKAIADGQKAVRSMMTDAGLENRISMDHDRNEAPGILEEKRAVRIPPVSLETADPVKRRGFDLVTATLSGKDARKEASRCLSCDVLCDVCTTVCPNRANRSYPAVPVSRPVYQAILKNGVTRIEKTGMFTITQLRQVINIGDFCNECGNCTVFCPSSGAPYIDKPTVYLSRGVFDNELSGYHIDGPHIFKRKNGESSSLTQGNAGYIYKTAILDADIDENGTIKTVRFLKNADATVDLADIPELLFLYGSLKNQLPGV